MSNSADEIMIPLNPKRVRHSESENKDDKDRLSDLPDCVILHILSFLKAKYAVRTCILSTRWKDLWKHLPTILLHSSDFSSFKSFTKFVSRLLSLRDNSVALQGLDFERRGCIEPHLLKRIVNYAVSHNVQRLGMSIHCDIHCIPPSFFSCQTLTSLKLAVYPKKDSMVKTLFPKTLNLPALTSLHLQSFAFSASDNDRAEPFSAFARLNSLLIHYCTLVNAQILCISSTTLVNFTIHNDSKDFYEIELSTPSLRTFAFTGTPYQQISGSNLSSLEHVNIDAEMWSKLKSNETPLILLCWLLELANTKSLTVTASTLQVLFLLPDLLKRKLPFLFNLKSLRVKLKPLSYDFATVLIERKIDNAKSRKEAAKLKKAGFELSPPIPDGIVDFLLQNSPSAEVVIINCSK
ncbi:Leucine-rich repeat domain superfamily [Sesbania bispinosa]|nr:Leucine-rich repeat domain superfamily [Sesbania bispinosa]